MTTPDAEPVRRRCEYHDAPPEKRKEFAGTKFIVISTIFGDTGKIVRCTCDEWTRRWRAAQIDNTTKEQA